MINVFDSKIGQTVFSTELYDYLELRKADYSRFVKRELVDSYYFEDGKDYYAQMQSNKIDGKKGQFRQEFYVHIDAAKKICMVSKSKKGNEIRDELVSLTKKRENLELISIPEAAFAVKVINALRFVENQKKALVIHKDSFALGSDNKYIYSEFNKYRSNIIGWDKESVDVALQKYLSENTVHSRTMIEKSSTSDKLSIIDINEAIRVAVLDLLFSRGTDADVSHKFAEMIKKFASEMKIKPEAKNETNLYQHKQDVMELEEIRPLLN